MLPRPNPPAARFAAVGALAGLAGSGALRAGGVTLVTHGFNGNVTDWVIPMAELIPTYPGFPGTDFSCYEIEITGGSSGPLQAAATLLPSVPPDVSATGEIFIKLDWSSVAGGSRSTTAVAEAAVSALLSESLIPELGGRALASLPLHFAGHSRGASVVTEMARLLGAEGVWVDHVTTLDPVAIGLFGDAAVRIWENALFADNYWQEIGGFLVPTGQPVAGAYNRELTNLGGGYNSPHSDVHLWYHATIELRPDGADDTQASIDATQRDSWWSMSELAGAGAGFFYSRLGGGDRASNLEPLGAGNGRIRDGLNQQWDLGAGVSANRTALPANLGAWPNVIRCSRPESVPVPAGGTFALSLCHQSGADASGQASLRVFLDADRNPWNGNELMAHQQSVAHSGPGGVICSNVEVAVDPATVAPGVYRVFAELSDGSRSRTLYAAEPLEVTPRPSDPMIDRDSLRFDGALFTFTVLAAPGQEVTIWASPNLEDWAPVATRVMGADPWQFADPASATLSRRFYRLEWVP